MTVTLPTVTVEIAFATDPLSSPTWTDVSAYFRSATGLSRGTQRELQRTEAGVGTVVLSNADRRFDPTYASSPYYPNVLPMRRIRLSAVWNAVSYPIFSGFIESWPMTYPAQVDAIVSIAVVDAFRIFGLASVPGTYPTQLTSDRVTAVLDSLSWLTLDRDISDGHIVMPQLIATSEANALTVMQDASDAEAGRLFMTHDGLLAFRSQGDSFGGFGSAPIFGEVGSEVKYRDVDVLFDEVNLENEERITRVSQGGTDTPVEQVSSDLDSQASYVKRSNVVSDFGVTTDVDALNYGNYRVARYSQPEIRVEDLALRPARDLSWPTVLPLDLGDKGIVRRRPKGSGGSIGDQNSFIEQIVHDITPGNWDLKFVVSPAARANEWWQLGDASFGQLDTTARVAY